MKEKIKPGLAFDILTPSYDIVSNLLSFGAPFMRRVLQIADIQGDERVLDVGCGTGTLILEAKKSYPGLDITGLDADENILRTARSKLEESGIEAQLIYGFAQDMPFPQGSFDLVISTLVFHHLSTDVKGKAIREVRRVLADSGRFLLADFGEPETLSARILLNIGSIFDGRGNLRANLKGWLPVMLEEAAFQVKEVRPRYHGVQFLLARKTAS